MDNSRIGNVSSATMRIADISVVLARLAERPISRLAPTPSGYLHIGNIYNFILTWILVRKNEGELILRIDDLDSARTRPEYIADIFETLEWLGIEYDRGPQGVDDFQKNYSQREKMDYYRGELDKVRFENPSFFVCGCSRKDMLVAAPSGIYPGTCLEKNLKLVPNKTSLKCNIPENAGVVVENRLVDLSREMGSFVVWRRDDIASYQLVSLLEDNLQKVNLIVRGEDLLPSTASQLFLSELFPGNNFKNCRFVHHGIILDEEGRKLSKSLNSTSVKILREQGKTPRYIYDLIARQLGMEISPEKMVDFLLF